MNCISPLSYSCGLVLHHRRAFPPPPIRPSHQSNDPNNHQPKRTTNSQRPSIIPKTLFLVKQIRPRTPQVDNLRTAIAILLQARTLEAVERVTDALTTAHDALVLVVAEGALVADAHEGGGTHVGIAHGAFTVAFVAQAADGDAGLLAAHDEIGVVTGHFACGLWKSGGAVSIIKKEEEGRG